jgi:hypothetical protein
MEQIIEQRKAKISQRIESTERQLEQKQMERSKQLEDHRQNAFMHQQEISSAIKRSQTLEAERRLAMQRKIDAKNARFNAIL